MKKILFLALCALTLPALAMPHKVAFDKLPRRSQEFVHQYFPTQKVISVELDRRSGSSEKYSVYFANGNQASFDGGNGDCTQIIIKSGSLPVGVLPTKIRSDIMADHPNQGVTLYERQKDGYRLQLTDGTTLFFNKDGLRTRSLGTE